MNKSLSLRGSRLLSISLRSECVLCGSTNSVILYDFGKRKVVRCNKCGLVRTEGKAGIDYGHYHRDEDYRKFEKMFRNIFLKRVKIIERFVKEPGRVLDIGASTGTFIQLFKKRGWETLGVEPSISGEVARKKEIKILRTTFEAAELPKNYFDVIILNHTLEHLEDPVAVLEKVMTVLKKSGIVFVDVPNFGGLSSGLFGRYWRFLTPEEHFFHFTKESLGKVMKKAGFKVIHQESRSGLLEFGNPFAELWDAAVTLKKRFFTDLATLPFAALSTSLNMGNSMSLIGKKVS